MEPKEPHSDENKAPNERLKDVNLKLKEKTTELREEWKEAKLIADPSSILAKLVELQEIAKSSDEIVQDDMTDAIDPNLYNEYTLTYTLALKVVYDFLIGIHQIFHKLMLTDDDRSNIKKIIDRIKEDQKEFTDEQNKKVAVLNQVITNLEFMIIK